MQEIFKTAPQDEDVVMQDPQSEVIDAKEA
jgi:hypothetical protein